MPNLNKAETGQVLRVNLNEDISTATAYKFNLEPRLGALKAKLDADGVVLGTVNITVDDESYLANQYLEYTTKTDDLDYAGQWRIKGEATMSATQTIIGDYKMITVMP